ncbi:unnamed protein product [Didymodactylos carnosus]|uniref:Ig-like domain-containing protein n=1 Tax=Didymodactylos carnosus TaxID=1234261 RepID=A0A8S2CSM6_9BILA|nr:unnamed protein product [Didymodactylos carnosus]CAF3576541.1 unnamed protein product [Didymodactylos carnosus]
MPYRISGRNWKKLSLDHEKRIPLKDGQNDLLLSDKKVQLSNYIAMEKIVPPVSRNCLIKPNDKHLINAHVINEIGIYGTTVSDMTTNKIYLNEVCGYLCRTKTPDTNEGGVSTGFSVLDCLDLNEKSLNIDPPQIQIPADAIDKAYSIELHCILTDNNHRRLHEIHWFHNNKPIISSLSTTKSQNAPPHATITNNITRQSYVSTLYYTGLTPTVIGSYACEYKKLKKHVRVELEPVPSVILRTSSIKSFPVWVDGLYNTKCIS